MKKLFALSTISFLFLLTTSSALAAMPENFGGNNATWNNDYANHYVNTNNPENRKDWDNQRFAVPGMGGHYANENAAVIPWGDQTLVDPHNTL